MTRIFFFLLGFGLMIVGFTYIILYMNLMTIGYNFNFYVNFIIRRIECYYSVIGFLIMVLSMVKKERCKYELYL